MTPAGSESFESLIHRLQTGETDAATEVFERYASRLIALARSRLDARLRQKVDPEDIAQSVFKSFFRRHGEGQFTLEDWGGLWGVLLTITLRKCGRQAERFHAARRDVRREAVPPAPNDGSTLAWEPPGLEPTPEEAAGLTETIENMMSCLDPRGQQVLALRLQGFSVPEISQQVGRTERTVHRTLSEIKKRLLEDAGSSV